MSKPLRPPATDTAQQLLQVTMMLIRGIAAHLRDDDHGLTPVHVGILARLDDAPCSLTELARHQAVRLPTMSRSISLLVDKGYATRVSASGNRRQMRVQLTAAGRRVLNVIKRRNERLVAGLLAPLAAAELVQVHEGLRILRRTLEPAGVIRRAPARGSRRPVTAARSPSRSMR
ncbi:MAG: MarR family transcriptional regulator [Gammaproteobacteria bacterium]|nr:MarR family transcriptional regulator [Gammaproteobacteria bacterium]